MASTVPEAKGAPAQNGNADDIQTVPGRQVSIQLTKEQFEQLYLQPGGIAAKGDLTKRFGNPTGAALLSFVLTLTPLSVYLMQWKDVNATSVIAHTGVMYFTGGLGLWIAGLLEWVLGNTFPFTVFISFGSFWFTFAFLNQPLQAVAAAFPQGAATPQYNGAVAVFLISWGFLTFIYMIGSLRTNIAFVIVFLTITLAFFLLGAGYYAVGDADVGRATRLFKAGGALAFVCAISGWYITLSLILGSTGVFNVPLGDLSGFLSVRD